LSPQQLYLLKEMTNNVIICFDNDVDETNKNAGQDGAKKVHKILSVNKINAINVCPPPNKDIGDAFTDETMKEWIKSTLENEYA
jgi:DNA primase